MVLDVQVDTRVLEGRLHELAKYARVAPGKVMKQEAAYLIEGIAKLTPPATYSRGRKAVAKDLAKVYAAMPQVISKVKNDMEFEGKEGYLAALTRAVRNNDLGAIQRLFDQQNSGTIRTKVKSHTRNGSRVRGYTQNRPFNRPTFREASGRPQIGGALNPDLHLRRRNRRGRVTGGNRWSQIVMKTRDLNTYRKKVQSRVGWAMAGWAPLADKTGARLKAWVRKTRLGAVSGTARVRFGLNPFIKATNFDVRIPHYQRVVDAAVGTRQRIATTKIDRLIAGKAVNLGFTTIEARN